MLVKENQKAPRVGDTQVETEMVWVNDGEFIRKSSPLIRLNYSG